MERVLVKCRCCRQSFPATQHYELNCVQAYLVRVLKIMSGMTIQEMHKLHRLRDFQDRYLQKAVSKLKQENVVSVVGIVGKANIYGLSSKAAVIKEKAAVIKEAAKNVEALEDQREYDAWNLSIKAQRTFIHEMRGRV